MASPGLVLRDLESQDVPTSATFAPENWRMALDAEAAGRRPFAENGIASMLSRVDLIPSAVAAPGVAAAAR